jgi:hypothetical protein
MSINVAVGRRPDGSSRRWTEPSTGCWRQGTIEPDRGDHDTDEGLRRTEPGHLVLIGAGPASMTRYPIGNSGRAAVSAAQAMPIRADLAAMLERAGKRSH